MTETPSEARDVPEYRDLAKGVSGAGSAWGLFGTDDQLGLLNLQTRESVRKALSLPQQGKVFPLSTAVNLFDPPLFPGRTIPRHHVMQKSPHGFDDVLDNFFPQSSSQWDSLAHVGAAAGSFYGGTNVDGIRAGRNSIEAWSRRGIVGRGVVLDIATLRGTSEPDPLDDWVVSDWPITVSDLEEARMKAGIDFYPGDVLMLHTGFVDWYALQDRATRLRLMHRGLRNVGLERSEQMAEYLWNLHVMGVVADNPAVEQWPPDLSKDAYPFGFLHHVLIGEFGMALGELWDLGALVADCGSDGVYECCIVSAPLRVPGGIGSPANALALK
jgi:kynurenine formamidase